MPNGIKKNRQTDCQEQQRADLIFSLLDKLASEVKNGRGKGKQDNLS